MSDQAVNRLKAGESLKEFHERILAEYPEEKIAPAVAFLRDLLPDIAKRDIADVIAKDPENWVAPYHFGWGMAIRNELRKGGFNEDYWPIWNLDDIYVPLVERAVERVHISTVRIAGS